MKILAPLFNLGTIWARAKVITIRRLPGGRKEENVCLQYVKLKDFLFPQLPGGLFSPCDKWKQLSLPKLLYFPFCLVTYLVVHQWRIIREPAGKVRTFEKRKIWKNTPYGFDKSADLLSKYQIHKADFFKLCVLLKNSELYKQHSRSVFTPHCCVYLV